MNDRLVFKHFIGSVHFSTKDSIFHGKLEGINDLVTFEGETVNKLKAAFEESVDDYIELCAEVGKDPLRSFKGSFNVRIAPELHSKAFAKATLNGKSLNQFVQEAIKKQVESA